MPKPIHAYRTTGIRVVRNGIPIYAECGHVNGVAFGEVLKVEEDLRDSPNYDTVGSFPVERPAWSMAELRQLRVSLGGAA